MSLTLVTGPANAAKARVVLDAFRVALPRDPVLVVPTFADVERYRRELAGDGAVFGVRVARFAWLVREMARRAGVAGEPLGRLARDRAAAAAVAAVPLERLRASAATPGFLEALLRLVDELEEGRIDPPRFTAALRAWAAGDSARRAYGDEVAGLYAAYRRVLDDLGRRDTPLHTRAALDALRTEPWRWGATPVLLYGFDDLTALQRDAVETLAVHASADVTVSLTIEPGRVAFASRATTYQELLALGAQEIACPPVADYYAGPARAALHGLERSLFEPPEVPIAPDGAVRTLEGGGERAEAELVAAHVKRLIRDEGYAPEDVAIVHRSPRDVAALLEQVLRAYEIPHALDRRIAVGHTALGRGVVALLRCAVLDGTADDLLAWLRTPGLLERPGLADRLEQQLRQDGVRDAAEARRRWEAERWPLEALDRVRDAAQAGHAALCRRLAAEASNLLAAPWRRQAPVLEGADAVDARVAGRLRSALRELAGLDRRLRPDAAELAQLLHDLEVRLGDAPGPGRVTVASPLELRARRVRALFVLGLQEGVFPRAGRPEPFLADDDRRAINQASGLRLRAHEDRLGAERYLLYAAVSRPTDLLVLSWRAADDDGAPTVRSPFADDVADHLGAELLTSPERRELGAAGWAGELAPTARESARAAIAAAPAAAPQAIASLGAGAVRGQLRARHTWSASAIEAYMSCPVRWFVERELRPQPLVPDPEPMVRGALAHRVLERALAALVATGAPGLTPEHLPEARRLVREALADHAGDFPISVNPERLRAALRRLEVDLVAYVEHAAHAGSTFKPDAFEVSFGRAEDDLPPLELDGGALRLQGRIDRLDRSPDGREALVYDYKGRTATASAKWLKDGKLQVALYLLAVRQVLGLEPAGGFYQPLGGSDPRPRGAIRAGADLGLNTVRTDRLDDDALEQLLHECADAARAAVEAMREGRLTPRPDTCGWRGGGCAHPTICRCTPT